MPVTRDMLVTELQNLLRLTAFEQTIATIRRSQARTPAVEQELAANADRARERSQLLSQAITTVGGVPDVVGSALGRLGALATSSVNQVQSLQGALLGDLTLEHQLRERTRYARALADTLGESAVLPVLDRLETAHTATIDWIEARLAEVAGTGTSALRATPLQSAVTAARRVAFAPLGVAAATLNQASALLARIGGAAPAPISDAVSGVVQAAGRAADTGVSVTRTATQRTEDVAVAAVTGVEAVADDVRESASRTASGTVDTVLDAVQQAAERVDQAVPEPSVADLAQEAVERAAGIESVDRTATGEVARPFAGYEKLTGDRVMGHVRDADDVAELQQILAFETANRARKGVLAAVQQRLDELSAST